MLDGTSQFSFIFWMIVIAVVMLFLWWCVRVVKPYSRRYTRMEAGEIRDTDLRLPYKKFKELYPESRITYMEYKQLQMQRAFKRALGSERNRRMVR